MSCFSRRNILRALAAGTLPSSIFLPPALSNETGLFREVAAESGLNFHHFSGATGKHYMPEIMGPGVGLFDYDNDGDLDIYLAQGTRLDQNGKLIAEPPSGSKPRNRLYKNLLSETGQMRFVDATAEAGIGHI